MIFLKLGGSLLTDKTGVETIRPDVVMRVAQEIAAARSERPSLQLLVGHGGGSFGHVPARKHNTRRGVKTAAQWRGFAEVHTAMLRLNRHVMEFFLASGLPAFTIQPSAVAQCAGGRLARFDDGPIRQALEKGLLPVVYGDVAFDSILGGTIISTEEILAALAGPLRPSWLLLAGETEGVYDGDGRLIRLITAANLDAVTPALGGSRGADVTGGMAAKVKEMVKLTAVHPRLNIRIFSGLEAGLLSRLLLNPELESGTRISHESKRG